MSPIVELTISDQRGASSFARGEITDEGILAQVRATHAALTNAALANTPAAPAEP